MSFLSHAHREDMAPSLTTFGHGTATRDVLAALLSEARLQHVVDVRRFPGSRHNVAAARGHIEGLARELLGVDHGDDVAGLHAGGGGRTPGAHVGELDPVDLGGVVGDGAEGDAEAAGPRRGGGDLQVVEGGFFLHQRGDHPQREITDRDGAGKIDLVEVVAGLVIVGVGAAEEVQHRQAGGVEAGLVGGAEAVLAGAEVQRGGDPREQRLPDRGGADARDDHGVVLHAADHVEVHISHAVRQGQQGMFGEMGGAEQAEFLAGPAWRALLDEAARLYGPWAGRPASFQGHAWRRARVAPGTELSQPLLVGLESGAFLGCAGDAFHPAGGVEGAYLSGLQLADRLHAALGPLS